MSRGDQRDRRLSHPMSDQCETTPRVLCSLTGNMETSIDVICSRKSAYTTGVSIVMLKKAGSPASGDELATHISDRAQIIGAHSSCQTHDYRAVLNFFVHSHLRDLQLDLTRTTKTFGCASVNPDQSEIDRGLYKHPCDGREIFDGCVIALPKTQPRCSEAHSHTFPQGFRTRSLQRVGSRCLASWFSAGR